MSWGAIKQVAVTMTSGATLTAEVDLGKSWKRIYLDMTGAASEVRLQASVFASANAGAYRQVKYPAVNSTTAGNVLIGSALSGGIVEVPAGYQYLKIETTAAVANGCTFNLVCTDS